MTATPHRGFSLIELLMVISIIGILSTVVLGSLNSARINARDARRQHDMHQIQNALALYAFDHGGVYPDMDPVITSFVYGLASQLEPTYIADLPEDPTRTGNNRYRYHQSSATNSGNSASYTILVDMEGDPANVTLTTGVVTPWCRIQIPGWEPGMGFASWENTYPLCGS